MSRTRAGSVSSGEHSLSSYNSWALKNYIGMIEAGERNPQAVTAWRQMYLSRAKLKASSSTSALLAGFAMVALVELDINGGVGNGKSNGNTTVSQPILIIFAVCTTLLVSVHLLALMMSTCILPHMDSVTNLHSASAIRESPHVRLRWYIELSWFFSTVLGLLLFLLEIGIVIWLKFEHQSKTASYVTTALLLPVFVIFIVFAVTFYKKLFRHQLDRGEQKLQEIEHQMHLMNDIDFPIAHRSTIASRPDVDVEQQLGEHSSLVNVASL